MKRRMFSRKKRGNLKISQASACSSEKFFVILHDFANSRAYEKAGGGAEPLKNKIYNQ